MKEIEMKRRDKEPGGGGRVAPFDLRLGSVKSCRQTLARLVREYSRGKIEEGPFKTLTWGVSQLIAWWKLETELQIEERVKRLEEIAEELENEK